MDPSLFRRRPDPGILGPYALPEAPRDRVWLHVALFVATLASMTVAGGSFVGRGVVYDAEGWRALVADGLRYAVPFLAFLTVHEFGHYLMARRYGISVSLPYFLPVPLPGTLGTVGAVIRIREPFRRLTHLFDVGVGGPVAGVVVALVVFTAGVLTLPPPEYLLGIEGHGPAAVVLARTGAFPPLDVAGLGPGGAAVVFGDTPLTYALAGLGAYRVPGHEVMHYPLLLAGWLGLFFTALNLLPVGQLDGGHVVYAMFGPRVHAVVSRVTVTLMTFSAALGGVHGTAVVFGFAGWQAWAAMALGVSVAMAKLFEGDWRLVAPAAVGLVAAVWLVEALLPGLAGAVGFSGWTFWVALILFLIRVDHPHVPRTEPLTPARRALGVACLVLFALSFSLQPMSFVMGQ
ncbi:MAG TPA: site-2 protease family protein [Rubricoccaceae bacterium]